MTDRFPLIINSEDQQIQELSSGDNLDLTGSGIVSDVFTVDTNSQERLRIDSSGRMGLGTTSVGHKLDLLVSGGADGVNVYNNTTGAAYYQLATTARSYKIEAIGSDLRFYDNTGSAEHGRIDSSGRLLVGTSSPISDALLQIQGDAVSSLHAGSIFFRRGEASTSITSGEPLGQVYFTDNGGAQFGAILCEADGTSGGVNGNPGRFVFKTEELGSDSGPKERMRIDSEGKVSIGSATSALASQRLTINYDTNSSTFSECQLLRIDGAGVSNEVGGIGFGYRNSSNSGEKPSAFIGNVINSNSGAKSSHLVFATRNATTDTEPLERLRIDSAGKVAIGTTSAQSNLHVYSSSDAELRITSGGANQSILRFGNTVDQTLGSIRFNSPDDSLQFYGMNDTERMRIDSSGRMGLGTSSPTSLLHIESSTGGALIRAISTATPGESGVFITGKNSSGASRTGIFKYDSVDLFRIGTNAGIDLRFETNDLERMRISANGNLNVPAVYSFTGPVSANVGVDSDGLLFRATSSIKYKKDVETLADSYADAILNCRPVWYRAKEAPSTLPSDWGYWGFIAEEVAEIDPRLVQWKTTELVQADDGSLENVACEPTPDGVQYDRFVPHLLNLIKRQQQAIETLETEVAALKAS